MDLKSREFAVAYIAGWQGVRYVFENGDGDRDYPSESEMRTFEEAMADAHHWCGIADTVGGHAKIVHIPSMTELHWYGTETGKVRGPFMLEQR